MESGVLWWVGVKTYRTVDLQELSWAALLQLKPVAPVQPSSSASSILVGKFTNISLGLLYRQHFFFSRVKKIFSLCDTPSKSLLALHYITASWMDEGLRHNESYYLSL